MPTFEFFTTTQKCQYLPLANEVWGKVMFLEVSVIMFTGVGGGGGWSQGGVPGPRGVPSHSGVPSHRGVPGLGGAWSWGGDWSQGDSRPTTKGEIEGIWSRPTTKGEVEGDLVQAHNKGEAEGDQVQAHTQGGSSGVHEQKFKDLLSSTCSLTQKGDCWTWNQRLWEDWVLSPLDCFLFWCSNDKNTNIDIFA